jgi:small multidrug resistance family-3 protein
MDPLKTLLLFIATALAEIVGCYLPYLWLKQGRSAWLLVPAAASLALFAWLLTLHETAAGRVYAAYGGVYIGVALLWLWIVDGIRPTAWDVAAGTTNIDSSGAVIMPPTIGAAMRCITSEPGAAAPHDGHRPARITATVIALGRTRSTAPSRMASSRSAVVSPCPARQMRLPGLLQVQQHDHAELGGHAGQRDEADAPATDRL